MNKPLFIFLIGISVVTVAGCAKFHPQPISPTETAAAFEARTLENPDLKKFIEANLTGEAIPWPPASWDLRMLTLVAFYYHPALDTARAQWGIAQAGIITAGARPNPSVSLAPGYISNPDKGVPPWLGALQWDIPIETAGKRNYRIAQAEHLSDAARLNILETAWKVRSNLRSNLLNLYGAQQTEKILSEQQSVQEKLVKALEKRLAQGEASRPDLTQTRISLNQVRLAWRDAQKHRTEDRAQLARALGLPGRALHGAAISYDFVDHFPVAVLPLEIQRQALLSRPDILSALAGYASRESALQLEIAKQYPDIHLGPGYDFDDGEHKWRLGLTLTLPILNRNEGPIAEAEARRREAAARFNELQARVIGELDRAVAGYQGALQKLEAANSLLAEMKKQWQSVQARFKAGEADKLALLSAQTEYLSLEISRLEALVQARQALGLLEDAVQRPLDSRDFFPTSVETNPRGGDEGDHK